MHGHQFQVFESYLQCPTKCWLRSQAEQPTGNAYAEWISAQNETYSQVGLKRLVAAFPECDCSTAPPTPRNGKEAIWRLAVDVRWKPNDLESHLQAVERVQPTGVECPLGSSLIVLIQLIGSQRNTSYFSVSMRLWCPNHLDGWSAWARSCMATTSPR